MAVAFVGAGGMVATANNVANPTALAPTKHASTATGDLMLCICGSRSNSATVGTPTGWTLLTGFPVAHGTASSGKLYVFSRIADGGANDAPTVTWTGLAIGTTGDSATARILTWSGATATQAGTVTSSALTGQTTNWTAPAITTTAANALAVQISLKVSDTAQTGTTTNFTERADAHTATGTGHLLYIADKIQASAGTTSTSVVTPSSTTSSPVMCATLAMAETIVPVASITRFRGRTDTVALSSGTWTYAAVTDWSQNVDETFRVRWCIAETAGATYAVTGQVECRLNAGAYQNVTTSSTICKAVASAQFNDGDATTDVLTGDAQPFVAGTGSETGNFADVNLNNQHTELEGAFQLVGADVANGDTVDLRIAPFTPAAAGLVSLTVVETFPLGTIANTDTAKYAGTLGAEVSTSTYGGSTLGAQTNTATYP